MALTGVLRTAYVQVRVTDLAAAIHHYRDILGLHVVVKVTVQKLGSVSLHAQYHGGNYADR